MPAAIGAKQSWSVGRHGRTVRDPRLVVMVAVGAVCFAVIIIRLFAIQIIRHEWYIALASGQRELFQRLYPERGEVFVHDRRYGDGRFPIATNAQTFTIFAVPKNIANPKGVAGTLASLLALDEPEEIALAARLAKPGDPYEPVARAVTTAQRDAILALDLPGIAAEPTLTRYYPDGPLTAQLTGFVGEDEHGVTGRYGIEGAFDSVLAGQAGSLEAERDPLGRWIIFGKRDIAHAIDGVDVQLTIERELQLEVCRRLAAAVEQHGAAGGTVVVLQPMTGALRAMCSIPSFDPNHYAATEDIARFSSPAIVAAYEPGSVFKPITMAAAIDAGAVEPSTRYVDEGSVTIGGYTITNATGEAFGESDMTRVLQLSINTGTVFAARKLGIDAFRSAVERFGFGSLTDIELAGEAPGNTKNLEHREEVYLATASYGQGITVTPLQLATAYAAIANGGNLMRPYLVEDIIGSDETHRRTEPRLVRRVIDTRTATLLQGMLVSVVREGHPKRAGVPGYLIGGKTGTAQIPLSNQAGYSADTIHTFAGIGPVDRPTFVMVVRIDRPNRKFADSTAAPLFGEIAKFIFQYDGIPPKKE